MLEEERALFESRKLHKGYRDLSIARFHKHFDKDYHSRRLKRPASLVKIKKGVVLDAGCGDGFIQKFLSKTLEYVGIDFDDDYLTLLWKGRIDAPRIVGEVTRLPFHSNCFDIVLSLEVIEHLPEGLQGKLVSELYRVLKKGGTVIICTPNPKTWFHASSWLFPSTPVHFHCVTHYELIKLLNEAGFERIKRIGHDVVAKYPHKVFRFILYPLRKFLASCIPSLDKSILIQAVKT